MTSKQDPVELDALQLIHHAAQTNKSLEGYMQRVIRVARYRTKKLVDGVKEST